MNTCVIRVYGVVQGVGFRPFVSRVCLENGITGTVANKGSYVEIHAQGENTDALFTALKKTPPKRSVILNIISRREDEAPFDTFEIIESEKDMGDIFVSPDIATCEKCREELFDPTNRRYLHPFINCTSCGPRLTILDSMPYDRERTSMGEFKMCPECEFEYTHPETRRYDAQPVCCNNCGPDVYIVGTDIRGRAAMTSARRAISEGKICAVKGIGGFHLCCDAKNDKAVSRLRALKDRPMKPFAVMMKNIGTVGRECFISEEQRELLCGHHKPIILLEKKHGGELCKSCAPDNPNVGVMLPYAPVQMLLFDYDDGIEMSDCLVMTSANARGAPICRTDEDALAEISSFCDLMLSNNRTIRLRCDDTVTDFYEKKPYMIRRSRGFAPTPVMLSGEFRGCVIAVGGELKNTFCLAKNSLLYPSAYVGDMADIRTVRALKESIVRMETLLEATPSLTVCDLHPKYNTTVAAESLGLPVMRVQHHYAHILSCMAENDFFDDVIGVSFDGTGYGADGTVWGGEILLCSMSGFERLSSIAPFIQSGGDLSAKEGWRIAAAILRDSSADGKDTALRLGLCDEKHFDMLGAMARANVNSVVSTSAGRLFDAVSAVLGIRKESTFEGEASTSLMFAAQSYRRRSEEYKSMKELLLPDLRANTNAMVRDIAERYLDGEDKELLAFEFHARLADMTAAQCRAFSEKTGVRTCALSGGVFQNKLLLELTEKRLRAMGLGMIRHSLIPPNDGGIALGQAAAGMWKINH